MTWSAHRRVHNMSTWRNRITQLPAQLSVRAHSASGLFGFPRPLCILVENPDSLTSTPPTFRQEKYSVRSRDGLLLRAFQTRPEVAILPKSNIRNFPTRISHHQRPALRFVPTIIEVRRHVWLGSNRRPVAAVRPSTFERFRTSTARKCRPSNTCETCDDVSPVD
jgi:hypothetical protein